VPDPQPIGSQVVVEVHACGLNRLDLWLEEGALPIPVALPRTPGGEAAGVVLRSGPGAGEWQPGDRVAVQSNMVCGECEFCRQGEESQCLRGELLGVQKDGGFAEQMVVPANTLVRLPETVSFQTSAALTLAGSTAMHMLTARAEVRPGNWVLVMGAASGVGSAAIQIAKHLGGRVITTGSSEAKRALGLELGAEFAVDTNDANWPGAVRQHTGKRGVDLVVEHVGGKVLPRCFECLARGGTVVTCGATAGREIQMNLWPFFVKQHKLVGSYGRNREDMRATLALAAAGQLKAVMAPGAIYALEDGEEAFRKLRSREVLGKVLICPRRGA
jgi:2-desacetyl-2-hydroxyethyl bacteriochlorophyllide A dehydrogenase